MQPDGDTTASGRGQESVLKSAALMSVGTLLSRVLGLARDTVMAALFPRMITDAYVVAFRLPNLFRRVLGEGSLAASFIPLYVELKQKNPEDARRLAAAIFSLLALVTGLLTVLGTVFMEPVMAYMVAGEGFQSVPGKLELTVSMARIMFAFLFFVMMYAFLMSLMNAHKSFFIPAMAPAALNICLVISSFLPRFQFQGDQLAWGVFAGGVLQLLLVAWPLKSWQLLPALTTRLAVPGVGKFFRTLLPSLLGMSILQILAVLNVYFASTLPEGAHSYIYLADRLLEFPQSLLSVSLGVALLPTLSELWARGQRSEMVMTTQRHVRLLLALSLPTAMGLFVLAHPIVDVVYRRGQFSVADANATADVLRIYALVLVFAGIHRVTVPAFYAAKNTWFPAVISAVCVVVHFFVADVATREMGLLGLVGATLLSGVLNLGLLTGGFRFYFGPLGLGRMLRSVGHLLPALAAMFFLAGVLGPVGDLAGLGLGRYLDLLIRVLVLGGTYILVAVLLRHPETLEVVGLVRRRVFRRS
jgi:putative peptidoglycan lipid II flippase